MANLKLLVDPHRPRDMCIGTEDNGTPCFVTESRCLLFKQGDEIHTIDGQDATKMPLEEVIELLRPRRRPRRRWRWQRQRQLPKFEVEVLRQNLWPWRRQSEATPVCPPYDDESKAKSPTCSSGCSERSTIV